MSHQGAWWPCLLEAVLSRPHRTPQGAPWPLSAPSPAAGGDGSGDGSGDGDGDGEGESGGGGEAEGGGVESRVPRYRVRAAALGGAEERLEVSGCCLRPAWQWEHGAWRLRSARAAPPPPPTPPPPLGAGAAQQAHRLKGRGAAEAARSRVRVWYAQRRGRGLPRRLVPCVGVAVGYDAARGLAVTFEDGHFWVGDATPWEWLTPTEEPRCASRLPPPPPPPCLQGREASAALVGLRLRVWLAHGGVELPCVGEVTKVDPSRGLLVGLPGGRRWVGGAQRWRWLRPGEPEPAAHELLSLAARGEEAAALRRGAAATTGGGGEGGTRVPLEDALHVELCGKDDGFLGSWYEAEVQRIEGPQQQVLVKILELLVQRGVQSSGLGKFEQRQEWWPLKRLRPLPPRTPDGWAAPLLVGDTLELQYEGGWWHVELVALPPPGATAPYRLRYAPLGICHEAPVERLRPLWFWSRGAWTHWHTLHHAAVPPPDPLSEPSWWLLHHEAVPTHAPAEAAAESRKRTKASIAFFGSGCTSSSSPNPSPRSTTERNTSLSPRQARLQPLRRPLRQASK